MFFLGGLPRSGTTLVGSILNQNPQIYCSEESDLLQILYTINNTVTNLPASSTGLRSNAYKNLINNFAKSFYQDINKPIIIDKNSAWGGPYNFSLASQLTENIKIISPIRPIVEILASFIALARKNPNSNFIDKSMINNDFWAYHYLPIDDARCEWLMRSGGEIDKAFLSIAQAKSYPKNFHIFWYEDIVKHPQKTFNDIYKFLDIPSYKHNFNNIFVNEKSNDASAYGMSDLHKINKTISLSNTNPKDILSDYSLNKWDRSLDFIQDWLSSSQS